MWENLPVESFCITGSGGTPSRSKISKYYSGDIPWVKSGELNENIILDTEEKINQIALRESSAIMIGQIFLIILLNKLLKL